MELMLSLIGAIAGLISIIDFFLRRPNVFFLFLTWALAVALGYQLLLWVGPALIGQQSWLTDNVTGENSPVGSVLPSFARVLVGSFLHSLVIGELVLPAYLIAMFVVDQFRPKAR